MLTERDLRLAKRILRQRPPAPAAPPKEAWTAWKVLNSSFGIFLLSSVFLSSLTFAFTSWREAAAKAEKSAESIKRLDLEITSRLTQLEPLNVATFTYSSLLTARAATTGESLPDILDRFYVVFPEYRDRSALSLLWELRSLVPPEETQDVDVALRAARMLPRFLGRESVELVTPRGEQDSIWRFKAIPYTEYQKLVLLALRKKRWSQ